MAARKKPEQRSGTGGSGAANDPRFISISRGSSRRAGIPIPSANPEWYPQAISWFNALKLSGQSEFYEASDWATAVMAAQIYSMFLATGRSNLLPTFERLSLRLGCTVVDRKKSRIELDDADFTDEDEDAADKAVIAWHGRLGIVRDGTDG